MKSYLYPLSRKSVRLYAAVIAGFLSAGSSHAQLTVTISPGDELLLPNTAGQTLDLLLQNTGATPYSIVGVTLQVEVGDGAAGPAISEVDVVVPGASPSTLFEGNSGTPGGLGSINSWIFERGVLTQDGAVSLDAGETVTLARVTLNTTGLNTAQSWSLELSDTLNGDSVFGLADQTAAVIPFSGTVSVVPEMNGGSLIGVALVLFGVAYRWQLGRQKAFSA